MVRPEPTEPIDFLFEVESPVVQHDEDRSGRGPSSCREMPRSLIRARQENRVCLSWSASAETGR